MFYFYYLYKLVLIALRTAIMFVNSDLAHYVEESDKAAIKQKKNRRQSKHN